MDSDNKWLGLKKRYIGLDLLRIMAALSVEMTHTTRHLNADYGPLQYYSKMGAAAFMTGFFMLSGFSLFVNYSSKNAIELPNMKSFFKKRILGIMPMYLFTEVVFALFYFFASKAYPTIEYSIMDELILAPIEILGLQSNFHIIFDYSHNGMTWFISCIVMCYLVYPLLQEVAKQLSNKAKIRIILLMSGILLYSPFIQDIFHTAFIYTNPFFRILEFFIGVLLASMKPQFDENPFIKKNIYKWVTVIFVFLVYAVGVSVGIYLGIAPRNYMLYSWIGLPCFIVLMIGLSGVESAALSKSKVIKYCCEASYVFYLAQLFSNTVCLCLMVKYKITNNLIVILLGWGVCIVITVIMHELIEKPVKKLLNKRFG